MVQPFVFQSCCLMFLLKRLQNFQNRLPRVLLAERILTCLQGWCFSRVVIVEVSVTYLVIQHVYIEFDS